VLVQRGFAVQEYRHRWHLGQYGNHADRFVEFFNDCMAFFAEAPAEMPPQAPSFTGVFTGKAP
jgi:hypothetical protein